MATWNDLNKSYGGQTPSTGRFTTFRALNEASIKPAQIGELGREADRLQREADKIKSSTRYKLGEFLFKDRNISPQVQRNVSNYFRPSLGVVQIPKAKEIVGGFFNDLMSIYAQYPQKIKENVVEASKNFENGQFVKGTLKAGGRTSLDTLITIWAPASAAIGSVLKELGGQKIIDKTGEVIADKNGITNIPAFQKFAETHPNAAEDFERILTLLFGGLDKGSFEPIQLKKATKVLIDNVKNPTPPKTIEVKGKTFDEINRSVTKEKQPVRPMEEPVPAEPSAEASRAVQERIDYSRTSLKIKQAAKETGIDLTNADLAPIEKMKLAEVDIKAKELLDTNYEQALDIYRNRPQTDVLPQRIFLQLKKRAIEQGDVGMIRELSRSTIGTEKGQGLKALDDGLRLEADPIKDIQSINNSNAAEILKGQDRVKLTNAETSKMAKVKEVEPKSWDEFINKLIC